jgi:hypothetical protein
MFLRVGVTRMCWMLLVSATACGGEAERLPCDGVTCSSRGFCVIEQSVPYCVCMRGFHPERLACLRNDADPCAGISCSDHGSCRVEVGNPTCDCLAGYRHLPADTETCLDLACELYCIPAAAPDGGGEDGAADDGADAEVEAGPGCGNGVVEPPEECDREREPCGTCRLGTRACGADCRWDDCVMPVDPCGTGEPPCEPGAERGCGECGSQVCQAGSCCWGGCTPSPPQDCGCGTVQDCSCGASSCTWTACPDLQQCWAVRSTGVCPGEVGLVEDGCTSYYCQHCECGPGRTWINCDGDCSTYCPPF